MKPAVNHFINTLVLLVAGWTSLAALASEIAPDEELQLFPTAAVLDEAEQVWRIPVHGWIYEPEHTWMRKQVFASVLESRFDLRPGPETRGNFEARLSLLIADNERGKDVTITLGGEDYPLRQSSPNGHFEGIIELPVERVQALADGDIIRYAVQAPDGRRFHGESVLLKPHGVSIISDIDDTVKVTHVLDHRELANTTFLQDFRAVDGMAAAYRRLADQGAALHFVSSSPWQLYPPLRAMLEEAGFPFATFHLKFVRFRDATLLNLLKPGSETKPLQIEPLLAAFPEREFILVGDSGEADPEVYGDLLARYPARIRHVYIRNITDETLSNARFSPLVSSANRGRWTLFSDPEAIRLVP